MVRVRGLEPPHLSIPEPKSGASTNFATPANCLPQYHSGENDIEAAIRIFRT